jgi:hypothetical protein
VIAKQIDGCPHGRSSIARGQQFLAKPLDSDQQRGAASFELVYLAQESRESGSSVWSIVVHLIT